MVLWTPLTKTLIKTLIHFFSSLGQVSDMITLDVEYKPEVVVSEMYIHAAEGNKVELVCNVHSHPPATVHWFKNDDMQLTNESASLRHLGHRFVLTFDALRSDDFGNYTCRARNKIGENARVLEISRELKKKTTTFYYT